MDKKIILFDLDGTLTDSGPGIMNCVRYSLERTGHEAVSQEVLKSFIGPPLVKQFMDAIGMTKEEAVHAVSVFRERYAVTGIFENSLYPGIKELLQKLSEKDHILGIASAKPMHFVDRVAEYFDIKKYFSIVKGSLSDNENPNKLDVLGRAISEAGYEDKKNLVYLVGDRKYDAAGARLSGIGFYGAAWGYAAKNELEEAGAKKIASDPLELFGLIMDDDN